MLACAAGTFVEPLVSRRTAPGPRDGTSVPSGEAGLPPDKGAETPQDRPAGARLDVKDQLTIIFCNGRSALMHRHHRLHHTTSSHEQLQGAAKVGGCLPSGLPPARPRPRGCLPAPARSPSLRETACDLTSTFPAAPSLQQLRLCLTSRPRQSFLPGCTASLPNPPFA